MISFLSLRNGLSLVVSLSVLLFAASAFAGPPTDFVKAKSETLFSIVNATVIGLGLAGLLVLVRLVAGRDWVAWWTLGVFTFVAGLQWMNSIDPGFGDPAGQAGLFLVIMALLPLRM